MHVAVIIVFLLLLYIRVFSYSFSVSCRGGSGEGKKVHTPGCPSLATGSDKREGGREVVLRVGTPGLNGCIYIRVGGLCVGRIYSPVGKAY